jgi:hypothetical protein
MVSRGFTRCVILHEHHCPNVFRGIISRSLPVNAYAWTGSVESRATKAEGMMGCGENNSRMNVDHVTLTYEEDYAEHRPAG